LTGPLIKRCYEGAIENGNAIPVVVCSDSVRMITDTGNKILNRNKLRLVQTPQAFHSKILLPAFKIDYKDKFTDEASVVEAFGIPIHLIEGDVNNIKITTPGDLVLAESLLLE
jgi:2-C-methyl-D-erythritol 4-phosphate cytidylyltransferase